MNLLQSLGDDITPIGIGAEFNFKDQFAILKDYDFPRTGPPKHQRCFRLPWINRFNWIEYSKSRDAVFCNTCRQFGKDIQEKTFTLTGYSNWKTALETGKGFDRHNTSDDHRRSELNRLEKLQRIKSGTSVVELATSSVLEKRRYYCKSIIDTVVFLAGKRLAFRGDWDHDEHEEESLFNSLFEFAIERDPRLSDSQKAMPANITYKSPNIQNEFIQILAEIVRSTIVKEIVEADCGYFTILFDGTKDKNGKECVSIAARFISKGNPTEVLLFFETTEDVDAKAFTKLILDSLNAYGLDPKKIICQCYDGAAVMNGYKSGVAKRLQDELQKTIPYVHCFNHRLRLVIIDTVTQIQSVKEFFEQIQLIYKSFKKPKVKQLYEGSAIKRLIDTRWTGHFQAVKAIRQNYVAIVNTLGQIKDDKSNKQGLDGDDIAICVGLHSVITKPKFAFLLVFMDKLLSTLEPADAIFQKREMSYHRAMPIIDSVKSTIITYREREQFEDVLEDAHKLIPESFFAGAQPAKRTRRRNTNFADFVIEETLGERSNEEDEIKSCFHEVIDVVLAEFDARFTENNDILLALSSSTEMDFDKLRPLQQLGIELPSETELKIAKTYVQNERENWKDAENKRNTQFSILSVLYEVRESFPKVYELYAIIETFGCSTAVCEASFSSLASINIPSRLSMTNGRMRNLAFLAFENKRLKAISVDKVLQKFNDTKQRRVQLF